MRSHRRLPLPGMIKTTPPPTPPKTPAPDPPPPNSPTPSPPPPGDPPSAPSPSAPYACLKASNEHPVTADGTSYYIDGSNAPQLVAPLFYTFAGVPPAHPMTLMRGSVGTCDPILVTATQYSGFSYYGSVTYSFANCTGGEVVWVDQNLGIMQPTLTVDSVAC